MMTQATEQRTIEATVSTESAAAGPAGLERLDRLLARREAAVLGVVCGLAVVLAIAKRFVQDDAFISFIYARNLCEGHGLTWFGTHIEGYTNFLWVLWMAAGLRMGIDPIAWSYATGITAFVATILALYFLGRKTLGSRTLALAAVVVFATNHTVASYATGGLETILLTALLTGVAVLAWGPLHRPGPARAAAVLAGVLSALAILTRLDSVVLLVPLLAAAMLRAGLDRRTLARFACIAAICLLPVAGWMAWKWWYYGRLLPNTYYAKVNGWNANGLVFLARYVVAYMLWPFLGLGIVEMIRRRRRLPGSLAAMAAAAGLWCAYIIYVGGDFMEFRFLVPVAPLLAILLVYLIVRPIGTDAFGQPLVTLAASMAILATASQIHTLRFRGTTADWTLDSIDTLATFYGVYSDRNWSRIGTTLGTRLKDSGAVLALHPAGAIPYYSRLKSIDMWGLNDATIASEGLPMPPEYRRPGHRRHASLAYLKQAGVTFVIGHPSLVPLGSMTDPFYANTLARWLSGGAVMVNLAPVESAVLVSIPVDGGYGLLAWYLTPDPRIDRIIESQGWECVELRPAEHRVVPRSTRSLPWGWTG